MIDSRRLFWTLVLLNILWAPVNVSVLTATQHGMSPASIALFRWGSLAALLFALLQLSKFRELTGARWPSLPQAIGAMAIGIVLFAPAHVLYYTALKHASTVVGTVLNTTAPIWVAAFSFFILREKLTTGRLVAIGLGFVGAYFVSVGFQLPDLEQGETGSNLRYLIGTIIECLGGVLATRLIRQSSGITILAFQILGAVISFTMAPMFIGGDFAFRMPPTWDWAAFGAIAFLVLVPGLLCWGAWYVFAEKTPLNLMVVTILVQPIVGALIGFFWTHEQLTTNVLVGTVVIVSALCVASNERPSDATS